MKILKPITSLFGGRTPDRLVEARSATMQAPVIQSKAQDRLYELIEREQLPSDVRETLAGALTGDLPRQQLLFQAMIDTWPRLQKNLTEVARSVASTPWEVTPFSEKGEEATDSAVEKARMVQTAIEKMSPRPAWDELSERGLVKALVRGYYQGHEVCEVFWDRKPEGTMPRSAKIVPPRYYDYPDTGEDRLMFSPDGGFYSGNQEDFPEHHFLIASNRGHGGHSSIAAPLRALTGYWLAATFGLKWLLQFAQLYGVPFRWAEYEDETVRGKVCNMLENIGSSGWGAFPKGTKLDFVDAGKSADSLPQAMLLEMADNQCDTFILGQTLTTDVGDSGSRALGDVHQEVRAGVIQGVNDFVGDIFNHQLIPSIIKLNYGNDEELPKYKATVEAPKDEIGMAQRDQTLISMGMEVGKEWLYERHGVPMPEEGDDDIFQPSGGNGGEGDPRTGERVLSPNETNPAEADDSNSDDDDAEEVEAGMVKAYNPNQKRASKGESNGGQWVSEDGGNSKGDEPKKSRGLSDEELARHAELEAKHNAGTLTDEERDEAQELVDKAARLAGYDVDNPMYHGTTHDFETFDPSIGSPEGDFGRGNYLTSSLEDAEANYAGGGPDLEGRIERRAEEIFDQAQENEKVAELIRSKGFDDGITTQMDGARAMAIEELHGGDDRLITAYTKLDNPAMIGENADGKQMYVEPLDMYDEDAMADYKPEAEALVRKEYELDATDDIADYSSEVREAQENWAADNSYYNEEAHPLQEAVRNVSNRFSDVEVDGLADLDSVVFEGGSYADVADTLRQKVFQYATNDDGDMVTGEAVRQVFEEMGHDSVVDYRVDDKFKNMAGNYEGNYHIISFKSSQIKSADIFTGVPLKDRFNDKDDRITFSHAVQAYNPNQKRGEKGSPNGGRWVKEDGTSSSDDDGNAEYLAAVESGDMDTAQAMVDAKAKAAGYDSPRVFHGTDAEFEEFKASEPNNYNGTTDLKGIYFSGDINRAGSYRRPAGRRSAGGGKPRMIRAYLKMDTPLNITQDINNRADGVTFGDAKRQAVSKLTSDNDSVIFDGDSVNGAEYIVFNPNQIKSADPVTYDSAGNVIPLSQRFDDKDDRITFSHAVKAYDPNQKRAKDGRWTDGAISRGVIDKVERSHIDSYDGQDDYELVAYKGDDVMGYLSYSEHEGDVSISMVETRETHKRKGIATELYKELVKLHGEKAISSSFATKDGSALRKALEKRGIIKKDGTVVKSSNAVQAYDPNQKRGAKGSPDGGRWVKEDGGGNAKDKMPTSAAEMGLMAREAADYWDEKRGFYDVGFPITPEEYQKNFGEAVENKGIISDINDPFRKQVNRELAVQMNNEEFNKFLDAGPKFVVVPYKGEGLSAGDFGRNSMSLGNAAGMTVRLNKRAKRMGYGIWGDEVDPASGNIGVDVGSVIRHEYGHIFWQNAMSKDQRTAFFDKVKDASIISSYAESSNNEVFPEALALVTHPKFDKNKYPDWVGEMSDWMKKELTK